MGEFILFLISLCILGVVFGIPIYIIYKICCAIGSSVGGNNKKVSDRNKAQPTQEAINLANQFLEIHRNISMKDLQQLQDKCEDMIDMAIFYLDRNDEVSYQYLHDIAEGVCYYYNGGKYPAGLLDEVMSSEAHKAWEKNYR